MLSVLVYKDTDICLSIPELVPSLLSLLQGKALEVIKVSVDGLLLFHYSNNNE